jgi:hypothetical protein
LFDHIALWSKWLWLGELCRDREGRWLGKVVWSVMSPKVEKKSRGLYLMRPPHWHLSFAACCQFNVERIRKSNLWLVLHVKSRNNSPAPYLF